MAVCLILISQISLAKEQFNQWNFDSIDKYFWSDDLVDFKVFLPNNNEIVEPFMKLNFIGHPEFDKSSLLMEVGESASIDKSKGCEKELVTLYSVKSKFDSRIAMNKIIPSCKGISYKICFNSIETKCLSLIYNTSTGGLSYLSAKNFIESIFLNAYVIDSPQKPTIFSDVDIFSDASPAIYYLRNAEVLSGYSDGTYKPDNPINRAEFTKIIVGAIDLTHDSLCEYQAFPDAPLSEWYGSYVMAARCADIISGNPDGTFRPANNINAAEAAKIIVEAFDLPYATTEENSEWYVLYWNTLEGMNAIPDFVTGPDHLITRGEMAEIVYKVMTYGLR